MGKKIPSDILRFMVLKSFEQSPSYGYEVVSHIEEVTDGYWSPSYGTIYPLIQRLEDNGLLKPLTSEEAEERGLDEGERKYFEITDEGRDEISPDADEEDMREHFEDLILGYLKIYKNKYGEKDTEELLETL